jgi:hypothetical protein
MPGLLSVWILTVTIMMPGRAPVSYQAGVWPTEEACAAIRAQSTSIYQEAFERAQQQAGGKPLARYPRTYACVESR